MKGENSNLIFVVDDMEENLSVLGSILRENNFNIAMFTSGKDLLESLEHTLPDMILLDIMMPEMDGFKICNIIKNNTLTREIPIIFISAKVEAEDIEKGFEIGGVDYITKPFKKKELLARIKTHIKIKNIENDLLKTISMKDKLFSIISHDLRGPVGNFMAATDMLVNSKNQLSEEKRDLFLEELDKLAKNSFALLENLLQWARSQQNLIKYSPTEINLFQLVNDNFKLIEASAAQKSICLKNSLNDEISAHFDLSSISTVIRNLLSNAIKFTRTNGIIEVLSIENAEYILLAVKDNGIGISEENITKLFKQDKIFSKPGTSGERGSGLGLLLCKEFVEANGGKLWVESELGIGTTFYFTLPKSSSI